MNIPNLSKPSNLTCETLMCSRPATHAYGPECEYQNLMYLCATHAQHVKDWIAAHPNDPVECKEHGRIGKVKNSTILVAL